MNRRGKNEKEKNRMKLKIVIVTRGHKILRQKKEKNMPNN
jgi:hypothetical protein